jgi:branched-chain amino acid transport system substrate-binding protein
MTPKRTKVLKEVEMASVMKTNGRVVWRGRSRWGLAAAGILIAMTGAKAPLAAEPGLTKDTIKLGMFGPLTGPVSIYGYPVNNGMIAVYKKVNDEGGIHGRKIEIVHEDGSCDPAKTRAAVKKLISRDEVFAIHGGSCSAAVFAARDIFVEEGVPYMVGIATLDKISAPVNKYVFTPIITGSAV